MKISLAVALTSLITLILSEEGDAAKVEIKNCNGWYVHFKVWDGGDGVCSNAKGSSDEKDIADNNSKEFQCVPNNSKCQVKGKGSSKRKLTKKGLGHIGIYYKGELFDCKNDILGHYDPNGNTNDPDFCSQLENDGDTYMKNGKVIPTVLKSGGTFGCEVRMDTKCD